MGGHRASGVARERLVSAQSGLPIFQLEPRLRRVAEFPGRVEDQALLIRRTHEQ